MKVLQINSHYNVGGAGKIVAYLHHQLLLNNFQSSVIYGRGDVVNLDGVYRIGSEVSNKIDALITRMIGSAGFQSWNATRQAIKIINREKPDILHLHGLHGYYINYNILFEYINKKNIPCVWTFHDCLAFTGKCGYPYECKKYIKGCYNCELLKDYPITYGLDLTKSMWNKKKELFTKTGNKIIVSPSKWMTGLAKQSFFGKYDCITINNGIDTKKIFTYKDRKQSREKIGFDSSDKIALGVAFGQENSRKGVKFIVQAAKDMPDVEFILIGWKKAKNDEVSDIKNIHVREFISNQQELAIYYASADVFLLPSLAENYATTSIEALASGTPVVGFNVGGIPEQANGLFGNTVECGNQFEFEKSIRYWCEKSDKSENERLERSSITIRNNSMDRMFNDYLCTYKKILEVTEV